MANFGFDDLAVVKPYAPVWRETTSAVGAEKLVLSARALNTLDEAAGDCDLVLGTTAVRNRGLDRPVVRLPDLTAFLAERRPARVAVLFGNEKTGLTNAYLEKCHAYLTVPTAPVQPSMNLSHAVTVVCYELARSRADLGAPARDMPPATAKSVEQLVRHAVDLFKAADYLPFITPAKKAEKIRRAFLNWRIGEVDVRLLHGLMRFLGKKLE